jgi:choline dehydrogenase-like flavoprotein
MPDYIPNKIYDAVVIGSGAGGGTLAYDLCKRGMQVLLVERGIAIPKEDGNWSRDAARGRKYNSGQNKDELYYVGGETKVYGAALYRLRSKDFSETAYRAGVSPKWPIDYNDLEPYYAKAEEIYKVHGSDKGDSTEPPHSTPYLYPPIAHEPFVQSVVGKIEKLGHRVSFIPKAIDRGSLRPCILCSTCDTYPCKLHAKMDAEAACVIPAMATGNLTLLIASRCVKLLTNTSGTKITAAEIVRGTDSFLVHGNTFVLSAGVYNSPEILLRSASNAHPIGLANSSGLVGRYLCGHNCTVVFPFLGWRKLPKLHQKTFALNEFYFGSNSFDYPIGVIQSLGQTPIWQGNFSPVAKALVRFVAQRSLSCYAMAEVLPEFDNRVYLGEQGKLAVSFTTNNLDSFHELRRIAVSVFKNAGFPLVIAGEKPTLGHRTGTVRFGSDPKQSVLNEWCQSFDVDNLYVVDACFLPSAGAVGLSLTIMAQALRVAEKIASR